MLNILSKKTYYRLLYFKCNDFFSFYKIFKFYLRFKNILLNQELIFEVKLKISRNF
jgi:hypothetical protein